MTFTEMDPLPGGQRLGDVTVYVNGTRFPGARFISVNFETGIGLVVVGASGPLLKVGGCRLGMFEKEKGKDE